MRTATPDDLPRILKMGRKFHEASNQFAPFSEAATARMLEGLIASPDGMVLISDGGMIGGVLSPAYCADAWVMAVELFWWSEDRRGLVLLKGFEDWAREMGANEVRMTTLTNLERADKILRRRNYAPLEISYGKVF